MAEMGKGIEGCARAHSPEKPCLSLSVSSALFLWDPDCCGLGEALSHWLCVLQEAVSCRPD